MAKSIDERVVSLRVNDREFQSAIDNVVKSLDGLKSSLKFKDSTKGFADLDRAASNVKFDGLAKNAASVKTTVAGIASEAQKTFSSMSSSGVQSVGAISQSFSALQTVAFGAFASIGAEVTNVSKNIVSMFTQGITGGLGEYELQMNSIQTILTNTASKGTSLEQVNAALAELNTYADQTIYNFSQMTHNIGTFTAAGVDLDTAVASIKGIANLAAASGSSATQAASAMYQLSQAIAAGRISLMDWNSVVNAGMGGELFQNALKRTAKNFGTDVDAIIAKYGSFRESLTEGQWLTTEVLTETLKQISGAYTEADLVAQGYSQSQAAAIVKMAEDAKNAATNITTFSKLVDTMKESIGSGWAQTWQIVFGDFEEARTFWTNLYSGTIEPLINSVSNARNQLLGDALGGGGNDSWSELKSKIEGTGASIDDFKVQLSAVASENGKSLDDMIAKYGSLDKVMTSGELSTSMIAEALSRLADGATLATTSTEDLNAKLERFQTVVDQVWRGDFGNGEDRMRALADAGYDYAEVQDLVNKTVDGHRLTLEDLNDEQLKAVGYTQEQIDALHQLADEAKQSGSSLNELIESMSRKSGRELLLEGLVNVLKSIIRPIQAVGNAFNQVFGMTPAGLYDLIAGFNRFSQAILISDDTMDKLTRTFKGVFSIIKIFTSLLGGTLGAGIRGIILLLENFDIGILDVTASIGDAMTALSDFVLSGDILTKGFGMLMDAAKKASPAVAEFFNGLSQYPLIRGAIEALEDFKRQALDYIQSFRGLDVSQVFQKLATDAAPYLEQFAEGVGDMASDVLRYFDSMVPGVRSAIDKLLERFPGIGRILDTARRSFQKFTSAVGGYFKELLQLSPADALAKIIDDVRNAFASLSWSDIVATLKDFIDNFDEFVDTITDGIKELAPDILDGLIDGLGEGFKALVDIMTEMGGRIISAIKLVLGIHSPSTVMYEIGQNIVQGLMNGISSLIGGVAGLFSGLADAIGVELSDINWGAIAVVGLSAGTLGLLFKFADALNAFGAAAKGLTAPAAGVGSVLTSISKAIDQFSGAATGGTRFVNIANGIKTIAEAIAIIAGAVAALTLVDTDKMWQAVGAVGAIAGGLTLMTGVMVGLSAVMGKFKLGSFKDIASIDGLVLSISGSFVLLAIAMKIMGSIDDKALDKGIMVMERFQLLLANVVLIGGLFGKGVDFTSIGKMMTKLATTFLLASVAIRIIGGMEAGQIQQAVNALGMITLMLTAVVAVGGVINSMGGSVDKVGSAMLKLSAAIGIMALICRMLGGVDPGALTQGLIATGALSLFIVGLIAATRLIGGRQIAQIGKTLLSISASIAILAGVAVALSGIDPAAFDNGLGSMTKVAALVVGIIAVMEVISKFGKTDLIKVGASLLLVSASIAILAGVAVLLSTIDTAGLTKGIIAVGFLSLFVAGMIAAAKGADKAKGTIIAVSVAVGILAAAVAALSFIPFDRLAPATAALGILMGMFALIMQSAKNVNGSIGTIITMSLVVTLLAGILIAMSALDVQNAMTNAVALSLLMATFAVSLQVMDNVKGISTSAMAALTLMAAIMAILALVLAAMSQLQVQNALPNAAALALLLGTMSGLMIVLSKVGVSVPAAVNAATSLSAFIGILGGVLTAIGGLATLFPQIQDFIAVGGEIFEGIGVAIGKLIGGIGEGIIDAISNSLPGLATALSTFAINLIPFLTTIKMVDSSVFDAIGALATAILQLTASSFLDAIASFLGDNGIENLGTKLLPLADAMVSFSSQSSGINQEGLDKGVQAASALSDVLNGLPSAGAWQKISGEKDWSTLSDGLVEVAVAMGLFSVSAALINQEGMDKGVQAATALNKLLNKLPDSSVWDSLFDGEKSWSTIGDGLAEFGDAMQSFSESVSDEDFSVKNIKASLKAASALNDFKDKLPDSSWLSEAWGGDSEWTEFGEGLADMGEAMAGYSKALSKDYNPEKVMQSLDALKKFIPAIQSLGGKEAPDLSGISAGFITAANQLGVGLRQYSEEVSEIEIDAVSASIDPMKRLVGAVQSLGGKKAPDLSGISTGFITAANQLGVGLRQYSDEVQDVIPETVTGSLDPLKQLVSTVQSLGGKGSPDLSGISVGFITAANQLGSGLRQYAEEVVNVNGESVTNSMNALSALSNTLSGMKSEYPGVGSFKNALTQLGDADLSTFNATFSANATTVQTSLTNFGTALSNASSTITNSLSSISGSLNGFSFGVSFIESINSAIASVKSTMGSGGVDAGQNFVLSISGTLNLMQIQAMNAMSTLCDAMIYAAIQVFDNSSRKFTDSAKKLLDAFCNGLRNTDAVRAAANAVSNAAADSLKNYDKAFSSGSNLIQGFIDGINSRKKDATTAASNVGSATMTALNNSLGEKSPSRFARKSGAYLMVGLEQGIKSRVDTVKQTVAQAGADLISTIDDVSHETTSSFSDTLRPTISPVMDLSTISKSERLINPLTKQSIPFDVTSLTGITMDVVDMSRNRQNDEPPVKIDTNDLVSELRSVREHIDILGSKVEGMNTSIVMDSGALVGSMYQKMDRKLGRTAAYKERGI